MSSAGIHSPNVKGKKSQRVLAHLGKNTEAGMGVLDLL